MPRLIFTSRRIGDDVNAPNSQAASASVHMLSHSPRMIATGARTRAGSYARSPAQAQPMSNQGPLGVCTLGGVRVRLAGSLSSQRSPHSAKWRRDSTGSSPDGTSAVKRCH